MHLDYLDIEQQPAKLSYNDLLNLLETLEFKPIFDYELLEGVKVFGAYVGDIISLPTTIPTMNQVFLLIDPNQRKLTIFRTGIIKTQRVHAGNSKTYVNQANIDLDNDLGCQAAELLELLEKVMMPNAYLSPTNPRLRPKDLTHGAMDVYARFYGESENYNENGLEILIEILNNLKIAPLLWTNVIMGYLVADNNFDLNYQSVKTALENGLNAPNLAIGLLAAISTFFVQDYIYSTDKNQFRNRAYRGIYTLITLELNTFMGELVTNKIGITADMSIAIPNALAEAITTETLLIAIATAFITEYINFYAEDKQKSYQYPFISLIYILGLLLNTLMSHYTTSAEYNFPESLINTLTPENILVAILSGLLAGAIDYSYGLNRENFAKRINKFKEIYST